MPGNHISPAYSLYKFFWTSINWLFPPNCVNCKSKGSLLCPACIGKIKDGKVFGKVCSCCGEVLFSEVCERCTRLGPSFDSIISAGYYEQGLGEIIRAIKYHKNIALGVSVTHLLVEKLEGIEADLVLPVPLGRKRLKQRGHNQAAMLAFPLALALKIPYSGSAVQRTRETKSQVRLNVNERIMNVKNAFLAKSDMIRGKKIILVDDVITTGATVNDCSRALKDAGALEVHVCTLARVNSRSGSPD